jgi:hypothetical protein
MTKRQSKSDLVGWAAIITAVGGVIAILLANHATIFPPLPSPTPTPAVIDTLDNLSSWKEYTDTLGSTIHINSTSGMQDNALEIAFDLKEYGYVGIAKDINPDRLAQAKGVKFFYRGSGASNTIELKLIYARGTVFSVPWHSITAHNQWEPLEALYGDFKCWPDTGPQDASDPDHCPADKSLRLDLDKVARLDFAVSNKPERGDLAGSGSVIVDNVIDAQ